MKKQHSPGRPWWKQLLRSGCWKLLSLSRTALQGLQWLWRLLWYLLICYTSCWDIAFQFAEELLGADHDSEGSEEEEDGTTAAVLEPQQAVLELQRLRDANEATLGRLEALEDDVRFLCTELGAEKLLWSSRFLELLREQQELRQRLLQRDSRNSLELLGETEELSGNEGEDPAGRAGDMGSQQGSKELVSGEGAPSPCSMPKDSTGWSSAVSSSHAQAASGNLGLCARQKL